MIKYKYGYFDDSQIEQYKTKMQKKIFWLILYTDEKTCGEYSNVDVVSYHISCVQQLAGLNALFEYSSDIVDILSTLEVALQLLEDKENFSFPKYRKLVLDAGAMIKRMKVGG